jgi:hypothetical protein
MNKLLDVFFIGIILVFLPNEALCQWTSVGLQSRGVVSGLAVVDSNLFAAIDNYSKGGIFHSTNNGDSWQDSSMIDRPIYCLTALGNTIFAGCDTGTIFRSSNKGASWINVGLPHQKSSVRTLVAEGPFLYAAIQGGGLFSTVDEGQTWDSLTVNLPQAVTVSCMSVRDSCVLFGTWGNGVYLSLDRATTWPIHALNNEFMLAVGAGDSLLFASSVNAIYMSSDRGTTWNPIFGNDATVEHYGPSIYATAFAFHGSQLIVGAAEGVFVWTRHDTTRVFLNTGLGNIQCLLQKGPFLFAGGSDGLYRRPISEVISSAPHHDNRLPMAIELNQNYPNPFNSGTLISFTLPISAHVELRITNTLGQEVAELASETLAAGYHVVNWQPTNLPSGVYFASLSSRSVRTNIKVLYLK